MSFTRTLSATAAALIMSMSVGTASAAVFSDFTVDPDMNPGTANSFVADKIVGGYVEVITFGLGTFQYSLRWTAGQFFQNDGSSELAAVDTGLGAYYGLYALVTGSGTFTQSGTQTTFTTNPGGSVEVFYDAFGAGNADRTLFTNPAAAVTDQATLFARTNFATDIAMLVSGVAVSGSGTLNPGLPTCDNPATPVNEGINCGSFGQTSAIQLSAAGGMFFTQPFPFYNAVFNSGQLNNFDVSGTQVINGSMDLVFNRAEVPEPATLALVGLALLGVGATRARNRKQA